MMVIVRGYIVFGKKGKKSNLPARRAGIFVEKNGRLLLSIVVSRKRCFWLFCSPHTYYMQRSTMIFSNRKKINDAGCVKS